MNVEQLMRKSVKDFFETNMKHVDPFGALMDTALGIVSNDWNDNNVWEEVPDYDKAVEEIGDSIESDREGLSYTNPYEDVIDWVENDSFIDFYYTTKSISRYDGKLKTRTDRILVKDPPKWLLQLLAYCGIEYNKNTDFDDEYEQAKDEAIEAWKDAQEYARDPYAYYGVSRRDF